MLWQPPKIANNYRLNLKQKLRQANDWRVGLNAFKDREMFRIDMRHILGYTPEFWDFAYELTDLAEVVVAAAFYRCTDEMHKQYGEPRLEDGHPCPATVFALGKCGGRELGFASDIELMLIYGGRWQDYRPESSFYQRIF